MVDCENIQLKLNRSEKTVRLILTFLEKIKILKLVIINPYKLWGLNLI